MGEKRGRGRPKHKKDPLLAAKICGLALVGTPEPDIARIVGLGRTALRRYYKQELCDSRQEMLADVVQTLYKRAKAGDTGAGIYICKSQLGWSDRPELKRGDDQEPRITIILESEDVPERIRAQRGAGPRKKAAGE